MEKTNFVILEAEAKMVVTRVFDAPRSRVWSAWTTAEGLEAWWAPRPWRAVTKSFQFGEGGHWHYYMVGPAGEQEWCMERYLTVTPEESFTAKDEFSTEDGTPRPDFPSNHWLVEFSDDGTATKVTVTTTYDSPEDLKKILEMGMKEGFTMALDHLDELLTNS